MRRPFQNASFSERHMKATGLKPIEREDWELVCFEYLDFVRTQPCIATGKDGVEAAHLKHVGRGYDKSKPHPRHFTAVPMTHRVHMEWHSNMTKKEFEKKYNVNVWQENVRLLIRFITGEEIQ